MRKRVISGATKAASGRVRSYLGLAFRVLTISVVLSLALPGLGSAADIRVLILDDTHTSLPRHEGLSRVGNLQGKFLFQGSEYKGKIEIFRGDTGLFVVNELPIEDYIKSVVGSEVAQTWPLEALKAQAVASRTYAIYNMQRNESNIYHLASSSLSQVYRGNIASPEVDRAVESTRGEILVYEGEPINAMYHSTSGGVTELPEEVFQQSFPYLQSVVTDCDSSPYYMWERRIAGRDIGESLGIGNVDSIEAISLTKTGRVKSLRIGSGSEQLNMEAKKFRELLGWKRLPSTWFTVSRTDRYFVFRGKGYGHGVGMCQWSAMEMAKRGKSYREILSTFYPNTMIVLHEK